MIKKLILLLCLTPIVALGQTQGTYFEHGLSWEQLKAKAKKENKYLFVDCYTTWCGPCKYMARAIFPQKKVGQFFNSNFINAKFQLDKTVNDNKEIKNSYADAAYIAKEFNVRVYPSFLIFSPKGELVHRIVGSADADKLIAMASKALNPETQYHTLLRKYETGKANPKMLKELVVLSVEAYKKDQAQQILKAYFATQKDLYTKENLQLAFEFAKNTESKAFELALKNSAKVDAELGKGKASELLNSLIFQEEIKDKARSKKANIDSLIRAAKAKYPDVKLDMAAIGLWQVQTYQKNKLWEKFQPAVLAYMKNYGTTLQPAVLNSFAESVYENCTDADCISAALAWSKESVEKSSQKDPISLNIYAKLLYKLGKKEQAIAAQFKATTLAKHSGQKEQYQDILDKMKKDEKL